MVIGNSKLAYIRSVFEARTFMFKFIAESLHGARKVSIALHTCTRMMLDAFFFVLFPVLLSSLKRKQVKAYVDASF